MIYCRKYVQFKGCEQTIKYISIFDKLFDSMNARNFKGANFKRPLQESTYLKFMELFKEADKYIQGLQIEQPVYRQKEIVGYVKKPVLSTGNFNVSGRIF